ncbi:uncharacterized protein LOC103524685 [Diaphorina citri]|uniref:Uncharacterized protein LOC103524685 n=1 Tax=Diaphorina citri TaxID=121845 RepID=A0A3Q0II22_DIACI|nr:uncharacterized protein LOC103524685 [Diaphorina citri]
MSMSTLECAPHSSLSSNSNAAAASSSALNSFSISCSSSSFDDVLSPHSSSLPSLSPPLSANNNNNNSLSSHYYLDYQSPQSYLHNQISTQSSTSSIHHDESLGSCELTPDPHWPAKMSAVVAGTAAKKRKKPEIRPSSQLAKCLNEKRRREQENNYIEELAELISAASFAESMSSLAVKPDKCAILQETVNQQQETMEEKQQRVYQYENMQKYFKKFCTHLSCYPACFSAKCLNEKRRREQENNYIEELAELISAASFAESMSSLAVKPDKCAILQETVNQIRNIKQQETSSDAVQQGEVSSSKPTVITNEVLGPLLLEALEGFLFVVNPDGYVNFCTENIKSFIRYSRQEVLGKSVYNLIHHGDHARFHNCLVPSSHQVNAWTSDSGGQAGKRPSLTASTPNRTFNIRLLVKPISSTHLTAGLSRAGGENGQDDSGDVSSEGGPCLMCVARRIPPTDKQLSAPIEQFTMKLDRSGTIIGMDTSGVSQTHTQYLNKSPHQDLLNNPGDPHDIKQQDEENKATINNNNNNSSNNNNMLLCSLLNTNKDDDPVKKNQLLSQLLKEDEKMSSGPLNSFNMSNSHSALQSSLHLTSTYKNIFKEMSSSPSSPETLVQGRPRKRPSEESDDGNVAKRPASILDTIPSPIPSAAAHSELQKKNKMLASLLAQEPKNAHQPVPLLPADIISATPQEKLPRVVKSAPTSWSGGTVQQQQAKSIHQGRASLNLVDWGEGSWPMENQDRQLSEILDGVIDIIPDEFVDPSNLKGRRVQDLCHSVDLPKFSAHLNQTITQGTASLHLYRLRVSSDRYLHVQIKSKLFRSAGGEQDFIMATHSIINDSDVAVVLESLPQQQAQLSLTQHTTSSSNTSALGSTQGWGPLARGWGLLAQGLARLAQSTPSYNAFPFSPMPQLQDDKQDTKEGITEMDGGSDSAKLRNALMQRPTSVDSDEGSNTSAGAKNKNRILKVRIVWTFSTTRATLTTPNNKTRRTKPPSTTITTTAATTTTCSSALCSTRNPQYAISNQAPLTPQMLQQRQKMIQQQRQRLLQQQQQQQVVIPPSHAQADHNMDSLINNTVAPNVSLQSYHNIDSLINNTIAPNVSLQRSNSVPDSPSGYNLLGNSGPNGPNSNPAGQMSPRSQPNQQNPYPPSFSNGLRLSPGSPYQGTQLSPRVSQSGGQTPNYSQQNTWSPQQQQAQVTNSNQTRLSIQQQQNPMLSAQLTGNSFPVTTRVTTAGGNTSGYLSQQQQSPGQSQPGAQQRLPSQQPSQLPGVRSLTSPGARHSPFPPEVSPNTAASYQQGAQFRLGGQRASGPQTPTATTHLPGASIRHYNAMSPHHVYSPDQSSSPYCYDSPLVYQDRGRMGMSPGSVPGPPPNVGSGTNNGVTDYVRQEIRAIVGARQQGPRPTQQIQVGPGQSVSAADCEALGLYLEMPSGGNESPKMWASLPSGDMGVTSPPHRNSSDSNGSDQKNSSLLQKLLSE